MEAYTEALCRSIGGLGRKRARTTRSIPSILAAAHPRFWAACGSSACWMPRGRRLPLRRMLRFTVECNPDSMDETLLDALHRAGVNRLSVGVQSADEGELRRLGRRHSFAQAVDAVQRAQAAGFSNLSLDLMYGLPGQTETQLLQSARGAAGV